MQILAQMTRYVAAEPAEALWDAAGLAGLAALTFAGFMLPGLL